MITRTEPACQAKQLLNNIDSIKLSNNIHCEDSWQKALATIVRNPRELFELLELDTKRLPEAVNASEDFQLRVPLGFVQRMKKGDWNDPLLRQVLPTQQELEPQPGFVLDPLAETNNNPCPGLIHKYQGRVLLVISSGCAINCRYCFRRHFPYHDNNPDQQQWQQILGYIENDPSINEVIFSGGDPLAASDKQLKYRVQSLAKISHLTTLRIHTRLPIVIPERINQQCIDWLVDSRLKPVMVVHSNHVNELDQSVSRMLLELRSAGVTLLNQTVLLAGINDNADNLIRLSQRLFESGVLPYYLHLLDKVKGAAHFDVTQKRACQLMEELLAKLPGYLVPKLVREQAGAKSKVPIYHY